MPSIALPFQRTASRLLVVLSAMLLAGCGAYTIEGRVLRTGYPAIMVVPASDARLKGGEPIPGASISIIRDPGTLARETIATVSADNDGNFSLVVPAFGAGITDEVWLISAGRRGFARTENTIRLPGSPGSSRLLIFLSPGTDDGGSLGTSSDEIAEEIRRFMN